MARFTPLVPRARSRPLGHAHAQTPSADVAPDSLETSPIRGLPQRRRPRSFYQAWFEDWWLWELLAVTVSVGLTVVLCLILYYYQDKPVPSFGYLLNSGITLNTVVSLLATLSVAASLVAVEECLSQLKWLWYARSASRPLGDLETYDRASRGTVGSLALLFKFRLGFFPSAGALLMVLHLAIAPLTQQSIITPLRSVPVDGGIAEVPITNDWTVIIATENTAMPGGYNRINATMKGAVMNGMFAANATLPEVVPACPSGNCTFPEYQSLAVCSALKDVSSHLTNTSTGDGNIAWCLPGDHCVFVSGDHPPIANVTSAAGPDAGKSWTGGPLALVNYSSVAFADHTSPIADVYIIYQNTTFPGFKPNGSNSQLRYSAVEFVLEWCVPTFSTSVENGKPATTRQSNPFTAFKPGSKAPQPLTGTVNGTHYQIDQGTHATLQRYMWVLLSGLVTPGPEFLITFTNSDAAQALWAAFQTGQSDEWDFGRHQVPSQDAGMLALESILNNTATSMSNLVRRSSSQPPVRGTATFLQSTVQIEWGYVGVLIIFTGMALLFFLGVVVFGGTRRNAEQPPVWKSSVFAVLQGLDPALQRALGGATAPADMKLDTADLCVRLVRENEGWRLVVASDNEGPEGTGSQVGLLPLGALSSPESKRESLVRASPSPSPF